MLFSFQGSVRPPARPTSHPLPTFAAPASEGPHAGASRASLRGRLHRLEVEEVVSQAGTLRRRAGSTPRAVAEV